jgi:aspartyl-tRNA(Asn)/glutamyl-tRNA(Gln) amidotransferase subunit B
MLRFFNNSIAPRVVKYNTNPSRNLSTNSYKPIIISPNTGNEWQVCIGIEIHAQLLTQTKLFSGAASKFELDQPNTQVSFFDASIPGTLPVLNEECVDQAIRSALSFRAKVHPISRFERKHYFYADLPLGYQITQQESCLATNGILNITVPKTRNNAERFDVYERDIRITRLQLEQDSGKSLHDYDPEFSMIDLNRAGCGLVEIVSEPDIRSSDEAASYVRKIQRLLRHVGSCDGNMEEGSLRCDVNISIRPNPINEDENEDIEINGYMTMDKSTAKNPMGERVEVKNLNSIRSVIRAIDYEVERQMYGAEVDNAPVTKHETRTFDVAKGVTVRMRSKENAPDYRFLLDPDLPPLIIEERRIQRIVQTLPELPDAIRLRLMKEYGVSLYDASVLVDVAGAAEYYEEVIMQLKVMNTESKKGSNLWKQTLNWITNELLGRMRPSNITFSTLGSIHKKSNREENYSGLTPVDVGEMIAAVTNGTISGKIAKAALDIVFAEKDGASPMSIVEREGWVVVSDKNTLMIMCKDVIDDPKHSNHVKALQSGEKPKLIGFFVGQVMKKSNGQADPRTVTKLLQELLVPVES